MINLDNIEFEDLFVNEDTNEITLYFKAPRSYLGNKYPDADYCTISVVYPIGCQKTSFARTYYSPTKETENRTIDYDVDRVYCYYEFVRMLFDIYNDWVKENEGETDV